MADYPVWATTGPGGWVINTTRPDWWKLGFSSEVSLKTTVQNAIWDNYFYGDRKGEVYVYRNEGMLAGPSEADRARNAKLDAEDARRAAVQHELNRSQSGWVGLANTWNGGFGVLAGGIENSVKGSFRVRSGTYGGFSPKYYSSGWIGGSRAKITTYNVSKIGKLGGIATLVTGTVIDAYGVNRYYKTPNDPNAVHPRKAGTNLSVGLWGLLSPATAVGAAIYYGIDTFTPGGFPAAAERIGQTERQHRQIVVRA